MTDRSELVRAIQQAPDGRTLASAVAALDDHDRQLRARAALERETDLGAGIVAQRLTPVPIHEHHTAATDWLADVAEDAGSYRTAMIAEASAWYGGLDPAVRADAQEFAEQARGRARTLASAYASRGAAEREFLQTVSYLHAVQGASGLPQIDQTIDPNNQPGPTPYPTEVFPTFGEDQDQFNGVETDNHQSGISSQNAPLIQQIEQQNASGSGYGSGPERPDMHDTRFDTANSYAEVPLGPPGQIPTAPAATDTMGYSHPNPVAGTPQDAGADRRHAARMEEGDDEGCTCCQSSSRGDGDHECPRCGHMDKSHKGRKTAAVVEGYSLPDPFGYRWAMQPGEVLHPFHERCASAHWPEEACGSFQAHTASVAVGYTMNLDEARHQASCEAIGVREGLKAVGAAATLADLGQVHNRVAAGWNSSGRTADDTAVLHGFMAVVRPVLADLGQRKACAACSSGNCQNCTGGDCTCSRCKGKKHAAKGLAAGGVTEEERQDAPHHLPGTDKFPIGSAADVENAKHDIGRTSEPHGKVVRYIDQMAKEYHVAPVGGSQKAASRLGFQ